MDIACCRVCLIFAARAEKKCIATFCASNVIGIDTSRSVDIEQSV